MIFLTTSGFYFFRITEIDRICTKKILCGFLGGKKFISIWIIPWINIAHLLFAIPSCKNWPSFCRFECASFAPNKSPNHVTEHNGQRMLIPDYVAFGDELISIPRHPLMLKLCVPFILPCCRCLVCGLNNMALLYDSEMLKAEIEYLHAKNGKVTVVKVRRSRKLVKVKEIGVPWKRRFQHSNVILRQNTCIKPYYTLKNQNTFSLH